MSEPSAEDDEPGSTSRAYVDPHAEVLRGLAGSVFRAAVISGSAVWSVSAVVFGVWHGRAGLFSALVGGAVAMAAALMSLGLMRATVRYAPRQVVVSLLLGFALKLGLLTAVLASVIDSPVLHRDALAYSLIAGILVIAAAEADTFRRARIPTLIMEPDLTVESGPADDRWGRGWPE